MSRAARAGALLDASNSTGAPADVEFAIDGRPLSRSEASASAVTIEPGLEPTVIATAEATAAPAAAVTLEGGVMVPQAAALADPAAAAAAVDPAAVPADAAAVPAAATAGK